MNSVKIEASIRQEGPDQAGLGLEKGRTVKFFIDKAGWMLYSPPFICEGPTLRG